MAGEENVATHLDARLAEVERVRGLGRAEICSEIKSVNGVEQASRVGRHSQLTVKMTSSGM